MHMNTENTLDIGYQLPLYQAVILSLPLTSLRFPPKASLTVLLKKNIKIIKISFCCFFYQFLWLITSCLPHSLTYQKKRPSSLYLPSIWSQSPVNI